jgi:hypothetical protein
LKTIHALLAALLFVGAELPADQNLEAAARLVRDGRLNDAIGFYDRHLTEHPDDERVRLYRDLLAARVPAPWHGFSVSQSAAWTPGLDSSALLGWIPSQAARESSVQAFAPALRLAWNAKNGLGMAGDVAAGATEHYRYSFQTLSGEGDLALGQWTLGPSYRVDRGAWSFGADLGAGQAFWQLYGSFSEKGERVGSIDGQGQAWAFRAGAWAQRRLWRTLGVQAGFGYQQAEIRNIECVIAYAGGGQDSRGAGALRRSDDKDLRFSQNSVRLDLGLSALF